MQLHWRVAQCPHGSAQLDAESVALFIFLFLIFLTIAMNFRPQVKASEISGSLFASDVQGYRLDFQ